VLPEQVEDSLADAQEYVAFSYFFPGDDQPQRFVMPVTEFADLFPQGNMEEALQRALTSQQKERKRPSRRRGRRGRRAAGQRRQRIDYASPEYAGLPHRGRLTEAEKDYVRNHLDEVNERRIQEGHAPIDPTDPEMAERYGLTAPEPDAVEQEMRDQANL